MSKKLDDLVKKSISNKISNDFNEDSLANKIAKNADIVMGVIDDLPSPKKGSATKNLTFTFGLDEVDLIDQQIERFLKQGKNVSKSELIRIGLQLIVHTEDNMLHEIIKLIIKHQRGRPQ